MSNLNTIQRLLGAAAVALCACALPAAAQQAHQEAASSMDAQTVARDAATGQLRAATPEEQAALAALKAARQSRIALKPTLQKFHSSGASGARLTDEFMTSSTAVRTPDGKIEMICNQAHGDQPAVAHVHAAANTPVTE
jgi:hypothetical protein